MCWKCGRSESASIAGPFGVCAESLSSSPLSEASRLDRCTRSGQVRYYVTRPKSRTMVRTMAPRVSESESISQRQVNPFNSRPASWQLGLDNPFQQPLERALSVTLAAKPRRLRCRLRSRGLTRLRRHLHGCEGERCRHGGRHWLRDCWRGSSVSRWPMLFRRQLCGQSLLLI